MIFINKVNYNLFYDIILDIGRKNTNKYFKK